MSSDPTTAVSPEPSQTSLFGSADTGSGDSPTGFQCEVCERIFDTKRGLARHLRVHKGPAAVEDSVKPSVSSGEHTLIAEDGQIRYKAPTAALQRVGDTLISNISTVGTMAAMFAPHTGLTVLSRAPLLGKGIMEIASKNEQVMLGVVRFNQFFTGGELATAIASIGMAVSVDVGVTDAHGRLASMLIGDVVQQVDAMRPAEEADAV